MQEAGQKAALATEQKNLSQKRDAGKQNVNEGIE